MPALLSAAFNNTCIYLLILLYVQYSALDTKMTKANTLIKLKISCTCRMRIFFLFFRHLVIHTFHFISFIHIIWVKCCHKSFVSSVILGISTQWWCLNSYCLDVCVAVYKIIGMLVGRICRGEFFVNSGNPQVPVRVWKYFKIFELARF